MAQWLSEAERTELEQRRAKLQLELRLIEGEVRSDEALHVVIRMIFKGGWGILGNSDDHIEGRIHFLAANDSGLLIYSGAGPAIKKM